MRKREYTAGIVTNTTEYSLMMMKYCPKVADLICLFSVRTES